MKRNILLLALAACLLFSGCSFWMDGSFHSVTPRPPEKVVTQQGAITVESYTQLHDQLVQLIEQGSTSAVIYCPDNDAEQLSSAMATAVTTVEQTNAVCAYAVEDILFDIGERNAQMAISVQINYIHGKSELQRIRQAPTMEDAAKEIAQTLVDCEAGVVLRIKRYEDMDIAQFVQDYVDDNPQTCMEMPQVSVAMYPEQGEDRVVELTYTYRTSREALRNMQETVQPVFSSAELYVSVDADPIEKAYQLYGFLMGRDTYSVQTSLTPAYSLLNHGVGDSKAFAVVYAAMCRQSGVDCQVVSGTREGEAWCWNVLKVDGAYYHLDLLQCSQSGGFAAKTADEMTDYVWDYSAYTQ